uniref:Nuclear nucleic acid-binding protein C1D n=1 Tax=Mola mola TaxID=94237 RepID=A0A3Q4AX92_MOLML
MAADGTNEDYPHEIDEQLTGFDSSVASYVLIQQVRIKLYLIYLQLEPLDQAKLDLMSAYVLNSLFWMYLITQGVNPREHAIKQELERIRTCMNKVKEITDKKKAARLDKGAAARFVRNALFEPDDKKLSKKTPSKKRLCKMSSSP